MATPAQSRHAACYGARARLLVTLFLLRSCLEDIYVQSFSEMNPGAMSETKVYSNEVLDQGLHAARRQLHEAWGMIPQILRQVAQSDDQSTEHDSDLEGETDEDADEETDEQTDSVYISDTDEGDGEVTEHEDDHRGETDDETDQEIDEDVDGVYIIDDDDEERSLTAHAA